MLTSTEFSCGVSTESVILSDVSCNMLRPHGCRNKDRAWLLNDISIGFEPQIVMFLIYIVTINTSLLVSNYEGARR